MTDFVGTSGNDTLTGTSGIDRLFGLGGDDLLIGGHGADELDGGDDDDTADYSGNYGHVWVDLATGLGRWNFAHGDTLTGIENVTGTEYGDFLTGAAGANRLRGMGGDDTLDGGTGADELDGGAGKDTANYAGEYGGVWIDLATGAGNWNSAEGDVLIGVENVIGTDSTDWLTGNSGANRLDGGKGDDRLAGGAGADVLVGGLGADRLDGGDGVDTAVYSAAYGGIWIRLAIGLGAWNHAEGDVLRYVENVIGTRFRDLIEGDGNANRLYGGNGNDQLLGLAGDDWLYGGSGSDELDGGAGKDTLDYAGESVGVAINLSTGIGRWNSSSLEVDNLTRIEDVIGTALRDVLTGNGDANRLDGGAGDDRLAGNAGDDLLLGGVGSDVLFGDAGADRLDGGSQVDTADYSGSAGAVWIDLTSGSGIGHWNSAEGDRIARIEIFIGSAFDDRLDGGYGHDKLVGGKGDDKLMGYYGNDILVGGAGADHLEGYWDFDTVDYSDGPGAVWIDLEAGKGRWNHAEGDTIFGQIDQVIGSRFDDLFESDVEGFRPDPHLITGGLGNDTFAFRRMFGRDTVSDFDGNGAAAGDTIRFAASAFGPAIFTDYDDMLAHASQQGSDVVIEGDADNILVLQNTQLADLHSSDFIFG